MTYIQIDAIKFFFNCCKLWETQPLGQRVSLESTLRTTGLTSQDVRMKYIQNLKYTSKLLNQSHSLQYIAAFLDLLIVAAGTQSHFVVELFKEPEFA